MDSLPIEILTHILMYLPPVERIRLERVSKSWRKASRDTWSVTKELYVSSHNTGAPKKGDNLNNYIHFTEGTLTFNTDSPRIFHSIAIRVKQYITSMALNLSKYQSSQKILIIIAHLFHNIEVLDVHQTDHWNGKIFKKFFKSNMRLHSIECFGGRRSLESLPIKNWKSLHLWPIIDSLEIWERRVIPLVNNSTSLEDFEINELWSSKVMESLLKQEQLKRLAVHRIFHPEFSKYILEIPNLKNLKDLRLVDLEVGNDIIINLLKELSKHCHGLQKLEILCNEISIEAIDAIATLPELTTLTLEFGPLNDEHLIRLTKFRNLTISLHHPYDDCINYTDDGLIQMIKNAEELETLDISDLEITSRMFERLSLETETRSSSIGIKVSEDMFRELSEICKNSKIRIIEGIMKRILFH